MPQIFKIGSYLVYFWTNEGRPVEPIHVHITEGVPSGNATKVWITRTGKTLLGNNNSQIPANKLNNILRIIEARSAEIIEIWQEYFGEISYYC